MFFESFTLIKSIYFIILQFLITVHCAARQDVNVSIDGGTRVEIKGVPRIPLIPKLVHNEAMRQKTLLEIRHEIKSRGVTAKNFKPEFCDVTDILKDTIYLHIKNVIDKNSKLLCVKLPFFQGILRYHTQPGTNFAKEISEKKINKIKAQLPLLPWIRRTKYEKYGLEKYVIDDLILTNKAALFDRIVDELKIDPRFIAELLIQKLKHLRRKKLAVDKITNEHVMVVLVHIKIKKLSKKQFL